MKKFILIFMSFCFCVLLVGCDDKTEIVAGHINEITGALSTDYAIRVSLDDDDRVNEKYVDVQIKSSKENQFLNFCEENEDEIVICLPKKDYWYNLTYLISQTNGVLVQENYKKYEDFGSAKVFLFNSKNDVELSFRVVVGQTKTNEETKEEILVLSEPISKELDVTVKKKGNK